MNEEPCVKCIMRAMCINKFWQDIIDGCESLSDYLCDNVGGDKAIQTEYADIIYVESLNREFCVTPKNKNGIYAIGQHWDKAVRKERYITDSLEKFEEVRLVKVPPPTMLMKTYDRKK